MLKEEVIKKTDPRYLNGICHRGLHNSEFSENGMKAFENAINNNMAFEFDVHKTLDDKIVVCHDSNLLRMTGKEGIIENLTFSEIRTNYKLPDGTFIPLLEEVLDLNSERVPIVCEVKAPYANHSFKVANLTRKILDSKIKDKSKCVVISFNGLSLLKFKGYIRQLLVCKEKPWVFKFRSFFEGVDLDWVLLRNKKYQKYSYKHYVNVYTVESEADYEEIEKYTSTVTFQHVSKDYIIENQKKKYNK